LVGKGRRVIGETKKRSNIWHYSAGKGKSATDDLAYKHPAIFPEALARDHIVSWSNPGDTVLDPFLGSGTTGKMAAQLGRFFIGVDISQEYVDLAQHRIEAAA
jgi:site-specific DNA-methyltransferase (adenine-specific)